MFWRTSTYQSKSSQRFQIHTTSHRLGFLRKRITSLHHPFAHSIKRLHSKWWYKCLHPAFAKTYVCMESILLWRSAKTNGPARSRLSHCVGCKQQTIVFFDIIEIEEMAVQYRRTSPQILAAVASKGQHSKNRPQIVAPPPVTVRAVHCQASMRSFRPDRTTDTQNYANNFVIFCAGNRTHVTHEYTHQRFHVVRNIFHSGTSIPNERVEWKSIHTNRV